MHVEDWNISCFQSEHLLLKTYGEEQTCFEYVTKYIWFSTQNNN